MALQKRPTIKQIAKEAGVSISTVSNVLNGNVDEMSAATQVRVEQVIKRLKYRPNQIARGLVTSRTATIGMILAEIETPLFLQSLTSIEREARSAGYQLLLNHSRNEDEEQQALELMLEKQVEGIIFLSTSNLKDSAHLEELKDSGVPTVLLNRFTHHSDFDQVNWDNESGVFAAVEYLVQLGHRRIAHLLGPEERMSTRDRLQGYMRGLEAHGIEFRDEYLQNGDFTLSPDAWRESTRILLAMQQRPTAIIASDDMVAAVVIETLREARIDIPNEISVIGIDDQPILAYLSLTTVELPVVQAGIRAIELLIQRIAKPDSDARQIVLPCNLIERNTTGLAPNEL